LANELLVVDRIILLRGLVVLSRWHSLRSLLPSPAAFRLRVLERDPMALPSEAIEKPNHRGYDAAPPDIRHVNFRTTG
jgi:hypothetical protein